MCGADIVLPFRCPYCEEQFCVHHRIPESHDCPVKWKARAPVVLPGERGKATPRRFPILPRIPRVPYAPELPRPTPKHRLLSFGRDEPAHFLVGMLLVIAVGMSLPGVRWFVLRSPLIAVGLLSIFALSFAGHELAHKYVAQRHGLWAEFRTNLSFILITLMSVFLPFKVLAPGAVMISGPITTEIGGKTAIAGPITSISMAFLLYLSSILVPPGNWLHTVFSFGAMLNAFLAFFNLLPFFVFDGQKVLVWDKLAWLSSFIASALIMVSTLMFSTDGLIGGLLIVVALLSLLFSFYRIISSRAPEYPEYGGF